MPLGAQPIAMRSSPPDITTDPNWQAEQAHRLLGFEILQRVLHVRPDAPTPTDIKERVCITRSASSEIYRNVFIPRLLKKLGVENVNEAISKVRHMRDEIH